MRISDWSSDVCSSDLPRSSPTNGHHRGCVAPHGRRYRPYLRNKRNETGRGASERPWSSVYEPGRAPGRRTAAGSPTDRQSVVEGTSESVRVDLGGRRRINKKKI